MKSRVTALAMKTVAAMRFRLPFVRAVVVERVVDSDHHRRNNLRKGPDRVARLKDCSKKPLAGKCSGHARPSCLVPAGGWFSRLPAAGKGGTLVGGRHDTAYALLRADNVAPHWSLCANRDQSARSSHHLEAVRVGSKGLVEHTQQPIGLKRSCSWPMPAARLSIGFADARCFPRAAGWSGPGSSSRTADPGSRSRATAHR
jgi:hypothetical protein